MNRNIAVILAGRDAGLSRTLGAGAQALDSFNRKIDSLNTRSAKMAQVAKFAFQALAVAAAIAFGAAIKMAVDFQVQMQNVETVAHAGSQGIKLMGNAVLELATRLPQSTGTLTKGLYDIASSGFYGADALNVLEVSATAASAGLSSTAVASKAVVAVLNAWGLSAREAADVSDIMFKTVELGVLTFEDLASQLGDVIGSAAAANIGFDEVGSAIATMTLAGINASEAVTSLNRLIQKLIKPGTALAAAYRKMGFESGKAALDQLGLFGVMEKIRQATGGQLNELVRLFPEIRAARGAYALMAAGGEHYARVQALITDEQSRAGATQRAFNIQMQAVGNQFKVLTNQAQVFGIRVGTAFLPVLADAITLLREWGGTIADAFTTLARMAGPALKIFGDTLHDVTRLLEQLGRVASPVLRGLAGFTAAAAIGTLVAIAEAVEQVAEFLVDHPGLVRAVALAYGGFLVGKVLATASAFLTLQGGLMAVRLGLAGLTAQAVFTNIIGRISALGSALYALVSIGNLQNLSKLSTAFAGIGTVLSSPALSGVVLVAGLYAIQTGFDRARKQAEKMIDTIEKPFDLSTLEGMKHSIQELEQAVGKNTEEFEKMGSSGVTKTLRGTLQLLTPMRNDVLDNVEAYKALNAEIENLTTTSATWEHDLVTLSNMLGISTAEVEKFLEQLDYDPSDLLTTTDDLAAQIKNVKSAAESGTPATDAFVGALQTVSDPAASATDRVKALDDAIKGLIETALAMSNSAIEWEAAFDDVAAAVKENGRTLDITSEKGRAVASSINDAADAAIEHSKAVSEQTGNIEDGVAVLQLHREQLIKQMTDLGFSQKAAEDYVNALGLTPDNITTLVDLQNAQSAILELEEFQYVLRLINDAETKPVVDIDTSMFDEDYAKIAQALIQINLANPEAEVLLNGEKFTPTAEMVQAWALQWEASTPEAKALLSIIDPDHKFATLQQAAKDWESQSPQADARLDSARANAEFHKIESRMGAWSRTSKSARANLIDNATANINRIIQNLARIRDKSVTVSVYQKNYNVGGGVVVQRLGGVRQARGGLLQAGVVNRPAVMFGELATGGEAFIPKNGNPNRSKQILDQAASWYGMEVRPRGQGGGGPSIVDLSTRVSVTVNARGSITDQGGLVRQIRDVVGSEIEEHDRRLRRELASR